MKFKKYFLLLLLPVLMVQLMSLLNISSNNTVVKFPYKKAGLTEREAAAHLLNRFTFGPKQNQIDEVVKQGLENWFMQQLNANVNDDELNKMLQDYDALNMSNEEIEQKFPPIPKLQKMAIEEGFITKESLTDGKENKREQLQEYKKLKGLRSQKELNEQFFSQKIIRAAYSQNQLKEVMTDFWFNHFNVSLTKNQCAPYILTYERDAIRKNCLSNFETLLLSTAKSPAMLEYLDNAKSVGKNSQFGGTKQEIEKRIERLKKDTSEKAKERVARLNKQLANGLNENYARELMELHTLGVDGGYTQKDVTEAARVLTGWTVVPKALLDSLSKNNKAKQFDINNAKDKGFIKEGDFLFAINKHDDEEKIVLGKKFSAGGGYEEGLALFHLLATHPSCAKFISKKLAIHFVSDNTPQSLIDKMANTFITSNGDIKQVLLTMVQSQEFWAKDAVREKIKSPFELAISTIRVLNINNIQRPLVLNRVIARMGQQVYFYQAPTGFPDNAQYWINTGSLLNRINFGLAIASKKIPGLSFDLAALNNYKEPESAEKALEVYCKLLLPERNVDATIKRLIPLLNNPDVENKFGKVDKDFSTSEMDNDNFTSKNNTNKKKQKDNYSTTLNFSNSNTLSQVVGIIIGSPEFQRQ